MIFCFFFYLSKVFAKKFKNANFDFFNFLNILEYVNRPFAE